MAEFRALRAELRDQALAAQATDLSADAIGGSTSPARQPGTGVPVSVVAAVAGATLAVVVLMAGGMVLRRRGSRG